MARYNVFNFARNTQERPARTPTPVIEPLPAERPLTYEAIPEAKPLPQRGEIPYWTKGLLGLLALVGVVSAVGYGVHQRYFNEPAPAVRQTDRNVDVSSGSVSTQDGNRVVITNGQPVNAEPKDLSSPTLQSQIYEKLLFNVPEIGQLPRNIADSAVSQIKTTIYAKGFVEDEQRAWQYITPAVRYGLEGLTKRAAGFGYDFSKYSDSEIGQVLLPVELGEVNLVTGKKDRFNLETALFNVTANDQLNGLSPQEWLTQDALEDFNNKNSDGYKTAVTVVKESKPAYGVKIQSDGSRTRIPIWTNSNDAYQRTIDNLLASGDDLPVFIGGWSASKVSEQAGAFYSVVLASRLGVPAFVVRAVYPTDASGEGVHDEAFVYNPKSKNNDLLVLNYLGFWLEKEPFIKDYYGQPYSRPTAWRIGMGDERIETLLQ